MTEKEFKELKPGDKVKIVNHRTPIMNGCGEMDKWLGQTMTVQKCYDGGTVSMVESGHWVWDAESIEYRVSDLLKRIQDNLKDLSYVDLNRMAENVIKEIEERRNSYVIEQEETYYYISLEDGEVHRSTYTGGYGQRIMGEFGIVCKTQEDAEKWREATLYKTTYQRWCENYPVDWEDFTQKKYCLAYSWQDKKVVIQETNTCQADSIYCSDVDSLQGYLDRHKPEDIKKYILGIGMPKKCRFR